MLVIFIGRSSRSNRALKRLEDHNTSPEREKSVPKERSKKSSNSKPKQTDGSRIRSKDGGRRDRDDRECDSRNRAGSDVGRHSSHSVPHGRSSSTSSKSKKIEDKNSNGGSKTIGSDQHSISTSRKRDGEDKSRNGRDSVVRGKRRSRSCSPDNTAEQPHDSAGGKNGSYAPGNGSDGMSAFQPLHPYQVQKEAQLHLREADLRENVTLHLIWLMARTLPGGQEISLRICFNVSN